MRKLLLALAFLCLGGPAWAQNPTCPTRPAGDNSNACASTAFVQSAVSGGSGGTLTQYYAATTGNDSNTCLSIGAPCLTLQGAWNKIAAANHGLGGSQLNIADGTYTSGLDIVTTWTGAGPLTIVGNLVTPTNVFINVTGANGIKITGPTTVTISGVKLQTAASFGEIVAVDGANINFSNVQFAGLTAQHITSGYGSIVRATGNYSISGAGATFESHWHSFSSSIIEIMDNVVITITGIPHFTYFVGTSAYSSVYLHPGVSFVGSATGAKWLAHNISDITTNGLGVSGLPGDTAGTPFDTCGQYDLVFNCSTGISVGTFLTPDTLVTASSNAVATVAPTTTAQFHAVGVDAGGAGYACDAFGAATGVCVDMARIAYGTAAAKTSVNSLAVVKTIGAQAYDSTGAYGSVAAIDFATANAQTGTDHGGFINFRAVKPGTTVLTDVARFESSGISLFGTTSGSVKLAATAVAGSNIITFPAGTTDFSATGGTSRVVKQTSAGGAFTVAQLACSDLSGVGTGCSAAAGITALTGDVTASGSGSVAATLATAQPAVHTWALAQTFTVAPVFTDAPGTRTALGLGALATVTPGTGVAAALAINIGSAGAPVLFNGALGTPSSGAIATTLLTGALQAAQEPAHTGDVTNTAGSLALTLVAGNAGNLNAGTLLAARMPALTGEATTSAGAVAVTLTNSAVIGKLLTGYSASAGTVASTDSILQAFQKLGGLVDNAAWTSYSPTVSGGGGSCGACSVTVTGRSKTIGKTVVVQNAVSITNIGSWTGSLIVTLPAATNASFAYVGSCFEFASTGKSGAMNMNGASWASRDAAAGSWWVNGYGVACTGTYELP